MCINKSIGDTSCMMTKIPVAVDAGVVVTVLTVLAVGVVNVVGVVVLTAMNTNRQNHRQRSSDHGLFGGIFILLDIAYLLLVANGTCIVKRLYDA